MWFCYSPIAKAEWDIELTLDKLNILIRQIPTPSDIILYPISLLSSNNTSIFVVLNCNKINDDPYLSKILRLEAIVHIMTFKKIKYILIEFFSILNI